MNVPTTEVRSAKAGTDEFCTGQVRTSEVGALKIGTRQLSVAKVKLG
jgi:hypothetical protein